MIIGDIPSGYLLARHLFAKFEQRGVHESAFLWFGTIGAVFPDIDMIYFYGFDHRQHHHHTYFTHLPILWLSILALTIIWLRLKKNSSNAAFAFIFCHGGSISSYIGRLRLNFP
jgi:hypothetical protein